MPGQLDRLEMAVGDLNSTEKGSGARASGGKVDFTLLPLHLLAGTARVLAFGTKKYAAWNWAKGQAWSECAKALMRHWIKWWFLREEIDEESGLHHLDHLICNALFLRHYVTTYREGDDRAPIYADFQSALAEFNKKEI